MDEAGAFVEWRNNVAPVLKLYFRILDPLHLKPNKLARGCRDSSLDIMGHMCFKVFAYRAGVLFHHSQCLIQIQCKSFWTPASEDRESQVCPGIPGIAVHHGAEIRAPCRRSLAGARILTMHGGRLKFSHNPTTSFARCVDRGSFLSQVSTWTATALRGV